MKDEKLKNAFVINFEKLGFDLNKIFEYEEKLNTDSNINDSQFQSLK